MKILKDEKTLITFSREHIERREKMPLHIKKKNIELLRYVKNINRENRNKKELLLQMKMLLLFFSRLSSESLHIAKLTCLDNNDTMPHVMWLTTFFYSQT